MKIRTLVIFVYGISIAFIFVGSVMYILGKSGMLIPVTLAITAIFQGWIINKLFKQLNNKE